MKRLKEANGAYGKITYDYADSGNLMTRTEEIGGVKTEYAMSYGDASHPHAVMKLVTKDITNTHLISEIRSGIISCDFIQSFFLPNFP